MSHSEHQKPSACCDSVATSYSAALVAITPLITDTTADILGGTYTPPDTSTSRLFLYTSYTDVLKQAAFEGFEQLLKCDSKCCAAAAGAIAETWISYVAIVSNIVSSTLDLLDADVKILLAGETKCVAADISEILQWACCSCKESGEKSCEKSCENESSKKCKAKKEEECSKSEASEASKIYYAKSRGNKW